MQGFDFAQI